MKRKIYLANILRQWPIDAQRKALADVPKPVETYEDVLKPHALKTHSPAALKERAELLRPTGRRNAVETIHVASLGVLAWVAEDFMACMGAAAKRGATVVAVETGREIPPTASAADLAEALSEFLTARRRHQTTGGRLAGVQASRDVRMADTKARAALIADDWHGVDVPTSDLLERAGKERRGRVVPMAWATAVRLLGRRPTAEKMRAAAAKRMERQNARA
jgi:hypothetical protein